MNKIVHVVPDAWGPFVDIFTCLASHCRRHPRTEVISPRLIESGQHFKNTFWNDPDASFILWTPIDPGPKELRRCKVAYVYSEALDHDGEKLLPAHLAHWHRFKDIASNFDAVFTHTPITADIVRHIGLPTFVMPLGWDAEAMGCPRWSVSKHRSLAYHGSLVGRRELIVPYLTTTVQGFEDITGLFGRSLLGKLDVTRASLYIAHSLVESFSTWRLWQTASTSAALIAEPGDTWPFEADKHFVAIEHINIDNAPRVASRLIGLLNEHTYLNDIANEAHELARQYTIDRIEREFVIPALEAMR